MFCELLIAKDCFLIVSRSYYQLLDVAETADLQTIKKAFHRLSKILHPDTTVLPANEAAKEFHQVCEAYEILSDPISRAKYNNILKEVRSEYDCYSTKLNVDMNFYSKINVNDGNRRPLSGGEFLSLILLGIALCISLLLGIIFALLDDRDLYVAPSWLNSSNSIVNESLYKNRNADSSSSQDTIESTFLAGH